MKLRFSRQARADFRNIRSYIAERNPAAAERVLARLNEGIARIVANPNIGRISDRKNLYVFSVRTYPYRIYYAVQGDEVRITHVRHTARREWADSE
jgi:toxin ParE1/3/4